MTRPPITPDMIEFGLYPSGELAMEVFDRRIGSALTPEFGLKLGTATVALVAYGHPRPAPGCVWLKTWSENEGIAERLVAGGVVSLNSEACLVGPFNLIALGARLTPAAVAILTAQGGTLPA